MAITGGKFGTEVTTVAELLAGFGSGSFCPTAARLVMSPLTVGLMTTIWTVRLLVAGTVPKLHTTVPPALEQLPWLLLAETKLTPAGKKFDKINPVAAAGPGLNTPSMYVMGLLVMTGF